MKTKSALLRSLGIAALAGAMCAVAIAQTSTNSGSVDFGNLPPPATGDFVEVNVSSNLFAMVANVGKQSEPEIAEVLRNLRQIHVDVVGLDDGNRAAVQRRLKSINEDLDAQGWERVATVHNEGVDVVVHVRMHGSEVVEGLAATVVNGTKQAVLVNIVGDIRPDRLAVIAERFNIEPLEKLHLPRRNKTGSN